MALGESTESARTVGGHYTALELSLRVIASSLVVASIGNQKGLSYVSISAMRPAHVPTGRTSCPTG